MPISKIVNCLFTITCIILMLGCQKNSLECLPEGLIDSVLCYYTFNEENIEADISPFERNLDSLKNIDSVSDRWGNPNCAVFFKGGDHAESLMLKREAEFLNNLKSFSVSVWYQPTDPTRWGGKYETLVARNYAGRCPNRSGEWAVGLYDCRNAVFGHNNSVWATFDNSTFTTCDGVLATGISPWKNVIAVKNDTTYTIYKNGIKWKEDTGNANCTNFIPARDTGPLIIGDMFNGSIDDVIIFDKALSVEEITLLVEMEECDC